MVVGFAQKDVYKYVKIVQNKTIFEKCAICLTNCAKNDKILL